MSECSYWVTMSSQKKEKMMWCSSGARLSQVAMVVIGQSEMRNGYGCFCIYQ